MKKRFIRNKAIIKFLTLFSAVMLLLGSCATTMTQPQIVSQDYEPSEESGYIYGRFALLEASEGLTIGLVVQNLDNFKKYNFVLNSNPGNIFQIAAVPLGNYRVDSIEYINPKNEVEVVLDFALPPEQYQRNFLVELNTAIYIGDYSGIAKNSPKTREVFWSLQVPVNNYDETTVAIQETYAFLTKADITFVSNML